MWISKKKFKALEKKVAALEEEQLKIKSIIRNNVALDNELVEIVKQLRKDLGIFESVDANLTE